MRLPHNTARRIALVAALIAGPTLAACSNEGPLAPQASTRVAAPGANHSGFTVGWGATDAPNGATTQGAGTQGMTGFADAARRTQPVADSTAKAPAPVTSVISRR